MPKISVIVPVYNAEKYLHRCIDSILAQTFTDFELLLIDDGSKDDSGKICDEYAARDGRVRVFHKPNGGVSSARNLGLDNATGEWIAFIDSDDWVSSNYFENLWANIGEKVDLVFSYATIVYLTGEYKKEVFPSRVIASDDIDIAFVENALNYHTSPWSKLFLAKIVTEQKLRFDERIHIGEDAVFLFTYIMYCRLITFTSNTDYFYNYESIGSLTKRINSIDSELAGYYAIKTVIETLCKVKNVHSEVAMHKLDWVLGSYVRRVLNALYHNSNLRRGERLSIIRKLDLSPYVSRMKISSVKERLLAGLLKCNCVNSYDTIRVVKELIR